MHDHDSSLFHPYKDTGVHTILAITLEMWRLSMINFTFKEVIVGFYYCYPDSMINWSLLTIYVNCFSCRPSGYSLIQYIL